MSEMVINNDKTVIYYYLIKIWHLLKINYNKKRYS